MMDAINILIALFVLLGCNRSAEHDARNFSTKPLSHVNSNNSDNDLDFVGTDFLSYDIDKLIGEPEGNHKIERKRQGKKALFTESDTMKYFKYPIQKDTVKYHDYGGIRLKKIKGTGGGYEGRNGGFLYREGFPGIINEANIRQGGTTRIYYYNTQTKELQKTIDVKSMNPYMKEYENIHWLYPSFEYYEAPSENEKQLYESAKAEEYLSFSGGGAGNMNGYAQLRYTLVGIKEQKILTWESTLIILDHNGNIHASITESNQIGTSYLSANGDLVAYNFGGYPDNPYAEKKGVKIIDLNNEEVVFPDITKSQPAMSLGSDFKLGNVIKISTPVKYLSDSTKIVSIDFIDLDTRKRYSRVLSAQDYYDALREVECTTCLLQKLSFDISKI